MNLAELVKNLPIHLYADDITPTPVMRYWVNYLPLRLQGVIITGIRGCDGAPKDDCSKSLTSMIRRAVLNPADNRETTFEYGFFGFSAERLIKELPEFFHSLDQYPLHYISHLMHVTEIIGYEHPQKPMRDFFHFVYCKFVSKLHLNIETKEQMYTRLTEDRVAKGTVEKDN